LLAGVMTEATAEAANSNGAAKPEPTPEVVAEAPPSEPASAPAQAVLRSPAPRKNKAKTPVGKT